jgi:hypothetical protein
MPGPEPGLKIALEQIPGIDWKKRGNFGYNLELGVLRTGLICRLAAAFLF